MGAILFLLVTGQEPPDAATASAFVAAVRAAKTMSGAAVPDEIRVILDKSFNLDPSMRYPSMTDMKQAVSTLAHGGKYSASTFNLAFYLSNLLKKEMEAEAIEREKESKVNVAPYLEKPKSGPIEPTPLPSFLTEQPKSRSKAPLAIAAGLVVAAVAIGGWMLMKPQTKPAATKVAAAQAVPASQPAKPQIIPEPIAVSASPQGTTTAPATATTGTMDPEAARKAAFEEAVRRQMQAEMMKLQAGFEAELKRKQARNAPVLSDAAPAPTPASTQADERPTMTAAQLDQQRRDAAETPASTPVTQTQAPAPAVTQTQAPAPVQPAAPAIREGDVVLFSTLDTAPRPLRPITASYPSIARQQRISASIILSALINENGVVTDVNVLRGDPRFGLNDAAIRAMRNARFSSPMKDGKRVKTWFPQTFEFKP
jgi:TonB family protein